MIHIHAGTCWIRLSFLCPQISRLFCLLMAPGRCFEFDGVPLFLRQICYTCHARIDACSHPHSHSTYSYIHSNSFSHTHTCIHAHACTYARTHYTCTYMYCHCQNWLYIRMWPPFKEWPQQEATRLDTLVAERIQASSLCMVPSVQCACKAHEMRKLGYGLE